MNNDTFTVRSYDKQVDSFICSLSHEQDETLTTSAINFNDFIQMVGEYGEPSDFLYKSFTV